LLVFAKTIIFMPKTGSINSGTVPEIIDPVFAKTSQNARFLLSEYERFGLVFAKTVSIISGTGRLHVFSSLLLSVEANRKCMYINLQEH
jgi:hypothetical protein